MPCHPLEPLNAIEVQDAVGLMKTLPFFTPSTRVISVQLKEPPKAVVHGWPAGPEPDREACAVVLDNASNCTRTGCFESDKPHGGSVQPQPRPAPSRRCQWMSKLNASRPFWRARSFAPPWNGIMALRTRRW